ncbi:PREDICTED: tigger transposable element-derived protein 3-like [Nanorana parkeri]|uniref:tigger transposable element-derived protein 3-like n=1 Tax=Nanorana parkeri TaxID=125878 RepID=UPI0008547CC1|nr:PREDICTED: tigger transposable element-derived protein 3-like [Nanorana parkeri]
MDTCSHLPTYKKRRDSTLAEKVKILELLQQPKASQSSVARNMGLSQSTISRVMKKRDEILERWNQNENPSRKRNRPFKHAKVDEALLEWLLFAKANKLPISGPILMRQAEVIAKEIGCPQFKPSNGWLWRWKERYRLFYRGDLLLGEKRQSRYVKILPKPTPIIKMESNSAMDKRFAGCHLTTVRHVQGERDVHMQSQHYSQCVQSNSLSRSVLLARISKDYHLDDIFCAVGSPFQFRFMSRPGMTLEPKETVCIWFCCNMDGTEKLKLLVTHNLPAGSLGTHCLSPVSLKPSENGCLTDPLLVEWLLNWDAKLGRQERKILLAFTTQNAGPKVKLRNISLCIFPKQNPSTGHHFGEELVSEFNIFYRQFLLERLKEDTNIGVRTEISILQKMSEITLVEASYTMNKAWLRITPHTITSSFQKQEAIRILCSTKNDPPEARPHEVISFPISQESNSNVVNSAVLTAGQVSYRTITIKEESDDEHANLEYEPLCTGLSFSNQKAKVAFPTIGEKPKLTGLRPRPKVKDIKGDSNFVVKTEDKRQLIDVQEVRQACDVIQCFLSSGNQDMTIFCALQNQIERCLANSNSKKKM